MPRGTHPNTLANLRPRFTPETGRFWNIKANKVRWQFHPKRLTPEILKSPDSPLKRIEVMIRRTSKPERIAKLVRVRGALMKQERLITGQRAETVRPSKPPAKPLRFL